jgi:hypothetical protein
MTTLTAVAWLDDDLKRMTILREILDNMSPGERSRLNSPISARRRVERVLKARTGGTEEKLRDSPVATAEPGLGSATRARRGEACCSRCGIVV